jgi:hypothetical protein
VAIAAFQLPVCVVPPHVVLAAPLNAKPESQDSVATLPKLCALL